MQLYDLILIHFFLHNKCELIYFLIFKHILEIIHPCVAEKIDPNLCIIFYFFIKKYERCDTLIIC